MNSTLSVLSPPAEGPSDFGWHRSQPLGPDSQRAGDGKGREKHGHLFHSISFQACLVLGVPRPSWP